MKPPIILARPPRNLRKAPEKCANRLPDPSGRRTVRPKRPPKPSMPFSRSSASVARGPCAAAAGKISPDTLVKWRDTDLAFSAACARARRWVSDAGRTHPQGSRRRRLACGGVAARANPARSLRAPSARQRDGRRCADPDRDRAEDGARGAPTSRRPGRSTMRSR